MTEVRTRDEAIAVVDQALQTWSTDLSGVLTQAQAVAQAACDEAERMVRQRGNEVAAIEAMLSACKPEERRELGDRLARAIEASEHAKRAQVQIKNVASGVALSVRLW